MSALFKQIIFGCGVLLVCFNTMHAAGFVTHIYCAEKFLHTCPSYTAADKDAFLRGCVWPDGRYSWNISRTKTHEKSVTLHDVRACTNPCNAGKKFHCFVDAMREKYVAKLGILKKLPSSIAPHDRVTFLKVLEDEILYEQTHADRCMRKSLKNVEQEEMTAGVSRAMVEQWHAFVAAYVHKRPSASFAQACKEHRDFMGLSSQVAGRWSKFLPRLARDKGMKKYVHDLSGYFDQLFEEARS